MEAKLRLSIKKDGEHVYGDGRQALLLAVDKLGSLNKAAASLEMSYRAAWGKIKVSEERLGFKLLESKIGGVGGGGASLTHDARDLITKYSHFRSNATRQVEREFRAVFKS
ncbi:MAG TPA: LysR family transcriptional regulator [Actinobacteria bacterium]|nr:LysR family transcriptional regulator [Actinomycetes bacterium]HEX21566.1 LysR family transcriptional regulator [Actinomycetota bacterium]